RTRKRRAGRLEAADGNRTRNFLEAPAQGRRVEIAHDAYDKVFPGNHRFVESPNIVHAHSSEAFLRPRRFRPERMIAEETGSQKFASPIDDLVELLF